MGVFNGIFPVLAGQEDAARAFAKEVGGPRADQFNEMQVRAGISRETWSLQQTPMGSFVLVWFEGDVEGAFADLATQNDEFTLWFRDQIKDVTGIDMAAPNDDPMPEMLVEWAK